MTELAENLFPEDDSVSQAPILQSSENVLVKVPGVVVHLIEKDHSVELASGELVIVGLNQVTPWLLLRALVMKLNCC